MGAIELGIPLPVPYACSTGTGALADESASCGVTATSSPRRDLLIAYGCLHPLGRGAPGDYVRSVVLAISIRPAATVGREVRATLASGVNYGAGEIPTRPPLSPRMAVRRKNPGGQSDEKVFARYLDELDPEV